MGLQRHPALEASAANKEAAQSRVREAQSGFLPRLGYAESVERSDNPVFVFGSLLDQRQFTQENFNLGQLNNPNFVNNFQSRVRADQTLYDFGATKSEVRSAQLGTQIASEDDRSARMGVIAGVASAYFGAILAKERLSVALDAVRSAQSDLQRAENVRGAGMSTDADVLSVRVHLADMREREIQARYALDVASAALNDSLGAPLEIQHDLSTALVPAKLSQTDLAQLDKTSLQAPGPREALLASQAADAQTSAARSALWPKISAHGVFEADRQTFVTRGGANWLLELRSIGTCSMGSPAKLGATKRRTWRQPRGLSRSAPNRPRASRFARPMPTGRAPKSRLKSRPRRCRRPKKACASPATATKPVSPPSQNCCAMRPRTLKPRPVIWKRSPAAPGCHAARTGGGNPNRRFRCA